MYFPGRKEGKEKQTQALLRRQFPSLSLFKRGSRLLLFFVCIRLPVYYIRHAKYWQDLPVRIFTRLVCFFMHFSYGIFRRKMQFFSEGFGGIGKAQAEVYNE